MARYLSVFAVIVLAGCAGSTGQPTANLPAQTLGQSQSQLTGLDICDKGHRITIHARGGTFYAPCAGWKGTINYPPTIRGFYTWNVTSSVTNNFGAPPPQSGTAIFYIQTTDASRNRDTGFRDTGVTDTVNSPRLSSTHSYTLNVYNFLIDNQCGVDPCPPWTANIGSPQQGTHSITFASPLNGAVFNGGIRNVIWQFVQD
jgi:hypothetical protein